MCVESLAVSIAPDCDALKKAAGISPNFWLFSLRDLTGVTYDPTDGFITGFTFDTGKQAIKVSSKQMKHTYTEPIQDEGEGNVVIYQQTFSPKIYHSTQAERNAIEAIVGLDRMAGVYQGRDGKFYVFGVVGTDRSAEFADWGAKVTGGDDPSGLNLNDESAQSLSIVANMPNKAIIFGEGSDVATNVALLDGYLTPAV